MEFHKAAPYTYDDIDVITPTANRNHVLQLADRQMCRFEGAGRLRWTIAYGSLDPIPRMEYPNTRVIRTMPFGHGTFNFLNNAATAALAADRKLIVVLEDDDWYHPGYMTRQLKMFASTDASLLGLDTTTIYNVPGRLVYQHPNIDRAPLHNISFRRSLVPAFVKQALLCKQRNTFSLDWDLWKKTPDTALMPRDSLSLSIKGLCGNGITAPHNAQKRSTFYEVNMYDPTARFFKEYLGGEYRWYDKWLKNHQKPKFANGIKNI